MSNYGYGYGYGHEGPTEEERRKQEERNEQSRQRNRLYWDNITPEQREERKRKAAETRKRTREAREAQWARERAYKERGRKAAATRRRNNGTEFMDEWELEVHKADKRREYKQRYREKQKQERKEAYEARKPTEWRNVPGKPPGPWEFRGVAKGLLAKRNAKFWAYVDRSGGPDACWPWHGTYYYDHNRGEMSKYGSAYMERGWTTGAHRAAWILTYGFHIPYRLVVDHLCETPWCVNPYHLEVVTPAENNRRAHHREPEITRQSTSSKPPWDDRWYPSGRKKYDENGELKEKYRDYDVDDDKIPPLPVINPADYPADRHIRFRDPSEPLGGPRFNMGVDGPPLLDDDEEF